MQKSLNFVHTLIISYLVPYQVFEMIWYAIVCFLSRLSSFISLGRVKLVTFTAKAKKYLLTIVWNLFQLMTWRATYKDTRGQKEKLSSKQVRNQIPNLIIDGLSAQVEVIICPRLWRRPVFERTQGVWCVQTYTGDDFLNEQHKRTSTYGRAKVCPIDEPKTAP